MMQSLLNPSKSIKKVRHLQGHPTICPLSMQHQLIMDFKLITEYLDSGGVGDIKKTALERAKRKFSESFKFILGVHFCW